MAVFCKKCGTLYNPKVGPCPRCTAEHLGQSADAPLGDIPEEELKRMRRKAWIQLAIGIPAFIGLIYLIVYLLKLVRG